MALDHQVVNKLTQIGYYNRMVIEAGDTVTVDFSGLDIDFADWPTREYPLFEPGVTILVSPETGATVTVKYAMPPDFVDADFIDHPTNASITTRTNMAEQGPFAALRYAAAGAGCKIEIYTVAAVRIS